MGVVASPSSSAHTSARAEVPALHTGYAWPVHSGAWLVPSGMISKRARHRLPVLGAVVGDDRHRVLAGLAGVRRVPAEVGRMGRGGVRALVGRVGDLQRHRVVVGVAAAHADRRAAGAHRPGCPGQALRRRVGVVGDREVELDRVADAASARRGAAGRRGRARCSRGRARTQPVGRPATRCRAAAVRALRTSPRRTSSAGCQHSTSRRLSGRCGRRAGRAASHSGLARRHLDGDRRGRGGAGAVGGLDGDVVDAAVRPGGVVELRAEDACRAVRGLRVDDLDADRVALVGIQARETDGTPIRRWPGAASDRRRAPAAPTSPGSRASPRSTSPRRRSRGRSASSSR